jgi:peptide/nickel transport system substrate-binding protein
MLWSNKRRWMHPATWLVALVLVCSLPVWAVARDLVIGQGTDVSHLDPHYSTGASDVNVFFNLYDNLVIRDEHLNLAPGLAMSWQLVDGQTWQFKLRQGVVFHNGDPFTGEDVKFSLERAIADNPRTSVYAALNTIARIDILDPHTVNLITKHPDPLLPTRLSYYGGMMMPRQYFEKVGMDGFRKEPVGTGPIKFVEWKKNERLVLEANKRYWRPTIPYDKVIYKPYPETAARLAALLAGEVDFITAVPPDQVEVIDKSGTAKVEGALYSGFFGYYINVKVPPLDNKLVRQALRRAGATMPFGIPLQGFPQLAVPRPSPLRTSASPILGGMSRPRIAMCYALLRAAVVGCSARCGHHHRSQQRAAAGGRRGDAPRAFSGVALRKGQRYNAI